MKKLLITGLLVGLVGCQASTSTSTTMTRKTTVVAPATHAETPKEPDKEPAKEAPKEPAKEAPKTGEKEVPPKS